MDPTTMIPAPDESILHLTELVAAAEKADGPGKNLALAFIGARMGPVLARLAAAEDDLARVREELEQTRPAADAAVAWTAACDNADVEARPLEDAMYTAASKLQAWRTATGRDAGPDEWLVWSREYRTWWGPNGCRYTGDITQAGRYTREAAVECASRRSWRNGNDPSDVIVPAPPGYVLASRARLTAYVAQHITAATAAAIAQRAAERKPANA